MRIFAALVTAFLLCSATGLRAQLPGGTYRCTAPLGAVLLNGRYPLTLAGAPGLLDVTTAPDGKVSGRISVFDQPFDVKGQIKMRTGYARLTLSGKAGTRLFRLAATLQGGAFTGTVQLGRSKMPCELDVTATGPNAPECVLVLTVAPNGAISGPGTLSAARQPVAVKARGRISAKGVVSLSIAGPKVFLRTSTGAIDGTDISAAKWTGQGFGALTKGVNLRFAKDPP
jgi:hypothetical protein